MLYGDGLVQGLHLFSHTDIYINSMIYQLFRQYFYNSVVVACNVWKITVRTHLYLLFAIGNVTVVTRAVFHTVQWAIAKKTVDVFYAFMARIVLAISVFKISV